MVTTPPPSWYRVAAGARLVATAFVHQSTKEANTAAERVSKHTTELVSQSQRSLNTIEWPPILSAELVTKLYEQGMSNSIFVFDNDIEGYDTSTVKAGTAPYESQLRKKRELQQQQQQQNSESSSSSLQRIHTNGLQTVTPDLNLQKKMNGYDPFSAYLVHSTSSSNNNHTRTNDHSSTINTSNSSISNPVVGNAIEVSSSHNITPDKTIATTEENQNNIPSTPPQYKRQDDKGALPIDGTTDAPIARLREGQAVPSSRFGRALGFARLGAGLIWGAAGEFTARTLRGTKDREQERSSSMASDANADRLAATLCRMRGAALKMGQMLSIQDESLLPPALTRALNQVRQGADAMPNYQLIQQMKSQLGDNWKDKFESFDERPFAAASIGQVHYATIKNPSSDTGSKTIPIVVKVQYPGVAQSIESDLGNLAMLVKMTGFAPKGLFIENVIRVGRDELKVECNYLNEMANQQSFQALVEADPILQYNNFTVPDVFEELTTEQIITTSFAPGGTIDTVSHLEQEERNRIGRTILYLTMQELFEWRLMQTDPNWGNFLYDSPTKTTTLIDFGATREFPKRFVDGYLRIVWASANQDEATLMEQSHKMNFLTGEENDLMLEAHKMSGFTVGEPFWKDDPFDFRGSQLSSRMSQHTSVFLQHRLTPPPEEVYTLHRKLAGAYMLCIKLGCVITCRDMLETVVKNHKFEDGMPNPVSGN